LMNALKPRPSFPGADREPSASRRCRRRSSSV
jgi:hypothetical protein